MGYYTRAFCTSSEIPSLTEIQDHLASQFKGCRVQYEGGNTATDWESFKLYYKENKLPLLIELNKRDDEDNLVNEEIEEFIEEIGPTLFSISKSKVKNHLLQTVYIVVSQLPTSDMDNDGYEMNGEFLQFWVKRYGGLVQCDNEGFYIGNKLVVKDK